jgi:hypothetical protein
MTEQQKAERLVALAQKLLDDLIALSAPDANECDLQTDMTHAVLRVGVGYAVACSMPTIVLAALVQDALNSIYAIKAKNDAERAAARASTPAPAPAQDASTEPLADRLPAPTPMTEAQAREVLARLKEGGRVH